MSEKTPGEIAPTYFWLGRDGSPTMRWKWHGGAVVVVGETRGAPLHTEYREWIKVPVDE